MKIKEFIQSWLVRIVFISTSILLPILYDSKDVSCRVRVFLIIILIVLYILSEIRIKKRADSKLIHALLARVEELKYINIEQKLRANIFEALKNNKGYKIIYSYGMEKDPDREFVIDKSKGVTGAVFEGNGKIKLLLVDMKDAENIKRYCTDDDDQVEEDIHWICSIPIMKDGKVKYTLSLDGNKPYSKYSEKKIKQVAYNMRLDLIPVLGIK